MSTTTNEKDSVIDAVFDTATAWAVYGLGAAKRCFEVTARWLDQRAKIMGELATKLEAPAPSASVDAPTA